VLLSIMLQTVTHKRSERATNFWDRLYDAGKLP
jgi:hypothetical protein